jgi:hypothetical protein
MENPTREKTMRNATMRYCPNPSSQENNSYNFDLGIQTKKATTPYLYSLFLGKQPKEATTP